MKLRKIAAAVLSFTLFCGAVPFNGAYTNDSAVFAEEEYTEGTYGVLTYKNYGDYIEISDCIYDETITDMVIPEEIDGLPVTHIGAYAFEYCHMTTLVIPDTVTTFGMAAFCECEDLTYVKLSKNLKEITGGAFWNCRELETVIIPYGVEIIGYEAFSGTKIMEITLPESLKEIHYRGLASGELVEITIPKSVTRIVTGAFMGNTKLNIKILNPECVIEDDMFNPFVGGEVEWWFDYDGIIYGYDNSTAQAYAEKYGYNFEVISEAALGDTDGDGVINSSDASNVLAAYALIATGGQSPFTAEQTKAADVNNDGAIDSSDASSILAYYAYTATGGDGTLEEFLG